MCKIDVVERVKWALSDGSGERCLSDQVSVV